MVHKNIASDGIPDSVRTKIIALCAAIVPQAEVWLYGSRARGDHGVSSDIDLALDGHGLIPIVQMAELEDVLKASYIPYIVSLVDVRSISDKGFLESIVKDKIVWKD
jgi:uncharacterized protein